MSNNRAIIDFEEITKDDYNFLAEVYNYYIENTTATFHTKAVDAHYMQQQIPLLHPIYKSYVIKFEDSLCGFCYISNWKPRQAYDLSAEISIYLKPEFTGKRIGKQALLFLEGICKTKGIKNILGTITAENKASIKLFEQMDFVKAAHFKNIGMKFNKMLDVVIYQKEI